MADGCAVVEDRSGGGATRASRCACPARFARPCVVGDVGGRGTRRGPLGVAVEGPPFDGRRHARHRSAERAARQRPRSGGSTGCPMARAARARIGGAAGRPIGRPCRRPRRGGARRRRGRTGRSARGRPAGRDRARRGEHATASASDARHVAERSDRPAASLGLGARGSPTSRRSAGRTVAPSTTSCWPSSHWASATCCCPRGEAQEGQVVRTLVPVSVCSEDERGTYNNRVSAMLADLPAGVGAAIGRRGGTPARRRGWRAARGGRARRGRRRAHIGRGCRARGAGPRRPPGPNSLETA
jgi:hypothetical protein